MIATALNKRPCLSVHWTELKHTDHFRHGFFDGDTDRTLERHWISGEQPGWAYCYATIKGQFAELDYQHADVKKQNLRAGIISGVMRIRFNNNARSEVRQIEWRSQGAPAFEDGEAKRWLTFQQFARPQLPPYNGSHGEAKYTAKEVKERKWQDELKRALCRAYGDRCCVSGCDVVQVLDAAHLSEASSKSSYHPRNALLLRSDIHKLFDAYLLGIEPTSGKLALAPSILSKPMYRDLHGARIRPPLRSYEPDHAPCAKELLKRWKQFCAHSKAH